MSKPDHTNVIYDKMTGRVIVYEIDGTWVLPSYLELAHFENGMKPVFDETEDGDLYLRPNAIVVNDLQGREIRMGVVIKDFKLPESCDECQFNRCNTVDDTCHCEIKYLDTTGLFICRHDKWPLVDTDGCDTKYISEDEIIIKLDKWTTRDQELKLIEEGVNAIKIADELVTRIENCGTKKSEEEEETD